MEAGVMYVGVYRDEHVEDQAISNIGVLGSLDKKV